jgi:hypothetical protein
MKKNNLWSFCFTSVDLLEIGEETKGAVGYK